MYEPDQQLPDHDARIAEDRLTWVPLQLVEHDTTGWIYTLVQVTEDSSPQHGTHLLVRTVPGEEPDTDPTHTVLAADLSIEQGVAALDHLYDVEGRALTDNLAREEERQAVARARAVQPQEPQPAAPAQSDLSPEEVELLRAIDAGGAYVSGAGLTTGDDRELDSALYEQLLQRGLLHIDDTLIDYRGDYVSLSSDGRTLYEAAITPPRFQPTGQDDLAPSGPVGRAQANLAAIRVLRTLQSEGRAATEAELQTLARWSSWGAIPQIFDPRQGRFETLRRELRALLDDDEWAAAEATTRNAHYTDASFITPIWDALTDLGLTQGRLIEPGCGSGNFIGFAPDGLHVTGVELDPITAQIAAHLYPDADIRQESYVGTRFPDGYFDGGIGNVPFDEIALVDPRHNPLHLATHNHFILKTLDLVRDRGQASPEENGDAADVGDESSADVEVDLGGGLVAVFTSHYTMDSVGLSARREIAARADLIAAFRLPTGAMRRAAGTDALVDLLILQRRPDGVETSGPAFANLKPVQVGEDTVVHINEYFAQHPEHIIGTVGLGRGQYSDQELIVRPYRDRDTAAEFADRLNAAVAAARAEGRHVSPPEPEQRAGVDAAAARQQAAWDMFGAELSRFEGSLVDMHDGTFQQVTGGELAQREVFRSATAELSSLLALRDTYVKLLTAEATDGATGDTEELRQELNRRYGAHTARHGYLNKRQTRRDRRTAHGAFRSDPYAAGVYALEDYDFSTDTATKSDIFTRAAVSRRDEATRVETPAEALAICLDSFGEVRLAEIARLLALANPDEARAALGDLVFADPDNDRLLPADLYLSGNVREKLAHVEEILQFVDDDQRPTHPLQANATALRQVIQTHLPDKTPGDIDDVRLGATWIAPHYVEQFLREILNSQQITVTRTTGADWTVEAPTAVANSNASTVIYGTERRTAVDLAQRLLCNKTILVSPPALNADATRAEVQAGKRWAADETEKAQAKAEEMNRLFADWLWNDPQRASNLLHAYNERFNSWLEYPGDGAHLQLPGLSDRYTLRPHQKQAIARAIVDPGGSFFDHTVGFGKTLAIAATVMERRRLGLSNKPCIVVPNHLCDQWRNEFLKAYPGARVLAVDGADFAKPRRKEFVARIANGDWDVVIITQSVFDMIPLSANGQNQYVAGETENFRNIIRTELTGQGVTESANPDHDPDTGDPISQAEDVERETDAAPRRARAKKTIKNLQGELKRLTQKLVRHFTKESGTGISWEQTGIDFLAVDEVQDYANLDIPTRNSQLSLNGSGRAAGLLTKLRSMERRYGPGVGLGATGTPFPNSMTQAYVMLLLFRPDLLKAAGLEDFDAFAAQFMTTTVSAEIGPEGIPRIKERIGGFRNSLDFSRMWRTAAHVRTRREIQLPVPEHTTETVLVPATDEDRDFMEDIADRAEAVRSGEVDASEDNLLSISNDGRMGAMDLRMVGWPASPIGKLDVAAQRIFDIWQATKDNRYTDRFGVPQDLPGAFQMAFADRGTPSELNRKRGNFIAYDYLRDKLIELGMPAELIRYIHDAEDAAAKELLFKDAREGKAAVLMGSTQKMGTGVNSQDRLIALHHLDCPWRPSDVEQREGRIIRPFNQNPQVKLFRYVQEGSFDSFMWQTVERKARFIEQIRTGRSIDDLDDVGAEGDLEKDYLEFGEVKALATGNPLMLKKMQADKELALLETAYRSWRRTHQHLRHTVETGADTLQRAQNEADAIAAAVASRDSVRQDRGDDVRLEGPDGRIYTKRADLAVAIRDRLRVMNRAGAETLSQWEPIAVLDGLHIQARLNRVMGVLELSIRGVAGTDLFIDELDALLRSNKAPLGLVTRMENKVEGLDKVLETYRAVVGEVQMEIARATALVDKPFSKQDQLAKARARVAQLEADIEGLAGREPESEPASTTAAEEELTPYATADEAQTGEDAVIAAFEAWLDETDEQEADTYQLRIEELGGDIRACRTDADDDTPGLEAWAYYDQRELLSNAERFLDELATWNSSEHTRNLADRTRELQQATARHMTQLQGSGLLEQTGRRDPTSESEPGPQDVPSQSEELFAARRWYGYRDASGRRRYAAGSWLNTVIPAGQVFRASDLRPGARRAVSQDGEELEIWELSPNPFFAGTSAAAYPEAIAELVDAAASGLQRWGSAAGLMLDQWCRDNLGGHAPALAEIITDESLPRFVDALRVQLFETHQWAQPDPWNLEAPPAPEDLPAEQGPTEEAGPEAVPDTAETADEPVDTLAAEATPLVRRLPPPVPLSDEATQGDPYFATSDAEERRQAVFLDPYDSARDLVEDRLQVQRTAQALFHAEKNAVANPAGLPDDVAAARSALIDADTVLELEPPSTVEDSLAAYTALKDAASQYAELADQPELQQLAHRLAELTQHHLARFRRTSDGLLDLLPDANAVWQALDHTPVSEAPPLPPVIAPYGDRAELAAARKAIFETYEAWPQAYADDGGLLHAAELRGMVWELRNSLDEDVRHSAHAWERVLARGVAVAASAVDADAAAVLQQLLRLVDTHQTKLSSYADRAERDATPYLRPNTYGDAEQRLLEQWAAWNDTGYVRRLREIEANPTGDLITAVGMFAQLNLAMEVFEQQRTPDVRTRRALAAEVAASAHNLALALPSGDDAVKSYLARLHRFTATAYAHTVALEHSEDNEASAEAIAQAISSGLDRAPITRPASQLQLQGEVLGTVAPTRATATVVNLLIQQAESSEDLPAGQVWVEDDSGGVWAFQAAARVSLLDPQAPRVKTEPSTRDTRRPVLPPHLRGLAAQLVDRGVVVNLASASGRPAIAWPGGETAIDFWFLRFMRDPHTQFTCRVEHEPVDGGLRITDAFFREMDGQGKETHRYGNFALDSTGIESLEDLADYLLTVPGVIREENEDLGTSMTVPSLAASGESAPTAPLFDPDRWYRATLPDGSEQVTYGAWLNELAAQLPDEGLQFEVVSDDDGFMVTTRAGVERIVPMATALPDSAVDHAQAIDELLLRTATDLYPLRDQAAQVLPGELARRLEDEFPVLCAAAAAEDSSLGALHEALLTRFLLVFPWAHPESSTPERDSQFDRAQAQLMLADSANIEYRFLRALAVSSSDPVLDGPPEPLDLGALPEALELFRAEIEELMLAAGRALSPYGLEAADNFMRWLERHRPDPQFRWLASLLMHRNESDWALYRIFEAVFRWSRSMADRLAIQDSLLQDTVESVAPEDPGPEQLDDDPVLAQLIAQDIAALAGEGWTEVVQPFASQREATFERNHVEVVYERWAATQTALPMLVDADGELTDEEPGVTNPAGFVASWFHRARVTASTAGPTGGRMVVEQFEGLAQAARRAGAYLDEQDAYVTEEDRALLLQVANAADRYARRLAVTLDVLAEQQAAQLQDNQAEARMREVRALESAMAYLADQGAEFRMDRRNATITDREDAGARLRDDILGTLRELATLPPDRQNLDPDSRLYYGHIRGIKLYCGWDNLGTSETQAVLGFDELPLLDRVRVTAADLEALTPAQLIDRIDGMLALDALSVVRDREVAAIQDLIAAEAQAENSVDTAETSAEPAQAAQEAPTQETETAPRPDASGRREPQEPTRPAPGPSAQGQPEPPGTADEPVAEAQHDPAGEAAALDAIEDPELRNIALVLGPFTGPAEAAAAQALTETLYANLMAELPRRPRVRVREQRDLLRRQHEVLQGLSPADADALLEQLWAMARTAQDLTHHQDLPVWVAAGNYASAMTNLRARILATPDLSALVTQMLTLTGQVDPAEHPDPLGTDPEPYADAGELAAGRAEIFEAFRAWPGSRRTNRDLADSAARELRSRMRRLSENPDDHRITSALTDWHNAMLEVVLAAGQREDPAEGQQLHRLARSIRRHIARLSARRHTATSDPRSVITDSADYERLQEQADTARQAWEQTATYHDLQDLDREVAAGSTLPAAAVAQQWITTAVDLLRWEAPDEQLEAFRGQLTAYANAVHALALTLHTSDFSDPGDQAVLHAFLDASYAHAAAVTNTRTSGGVDRIRAVLSTQLGQTQEDSVTETAEEGDVQPLPYASAAEALTDRRRLQDAHAALQVTNLGKRLLLASDDAPPEAVALRRAFLMPHDEDLAGEPQLELDRLAAITGTTRALIEHLANTAADPTTVRNLAALADCAEYLMSRLTVTAADTELWTRLFSPRPPAPETAPAAPEPSAGTTRQSVPTALRDAGHTVDSTTTENGLLRYLVDGTEMSLAQAADRHLGWGRDVPGVPGWRMAPVSQNDPTAWEVYETATGTGHWQLSYSPFHKTWRIQGLTTADYLPDTFATVNEAATHAATTTPASLAMTPQPVLGLPGYTVRAVDASEHARREVLNPDGDVIATVFWSSFASQWAGMVGNVPTTLVSDPLIAAKHATVMWAYDAGITLREPTAYTSPADVRVTLATLGDSRRSLMQAASRAWTTDYATQPEIQQIEAAFDRLAQWTHLDAHLDTAVGLRELITVLDGLRNPAIALRARLAEETRQLNEGVPEGTPLRCSDREQYLAFRLVALLYDTEGVQAGLQQTIERLPAAAPSPAPSVTEATAAAKEPPAAEAAPAAQVASPPAEQTPAEATPEEETSMTTAPEAPIGGPWSDRIQLVEEDGGVFFTGTGQGDWYTQEGELRKLLRDNGFRFHRDSSRWRYQGAFNKRATAIGNVQAYLGARDEAARTAGQKEKTPQFPPTPQQQAIIDACVAGQNVVVQALAGTGKTTTMAMVARELSPKRVTYVAFNRDIADEARGKFPSNTDAATSHAFAARALRQTGLKQKVNNAGKNHPGARWPWQLTEALGINVPVRTKDRTYEPEDVARLVKATYVAYRNSADDKISAAHLPSSLAEAPRSIRDTVLRYARAAWKDIEDPVSNKVHFDFDDYLKLWALTKPTLPGEVIIFDEAQDINPVLSRVIQEQTHQTIVVGDSNQSIYAFRGAEDALTDWPADIELPLTQSWRFGTEVARIGNEFLTLLGSPFILEGNPNLGSTLGSVTEPDAVLAKTNAGALAAVVAALEQGRRVALAGGKKDIVDIADAAADLMAGRGTKHAELASFKDWDEVRELVEREDNDAKHLETFVRLVDAHSPRGLKDIAAQLVDIKIQEEELRAEVVVSTAHRSKGLEFDNVLIAGDFPGPKIDPEMGEPNLPSPENLRLMYVAVTRAKNRLDLGSLQWIEDLPGLMADPRSVIPALEQEPQPDTAPAEAPAPTTATDAPRSPTTDREPQSRAGQLTPDPRPAVPAQAEPVPPAADAGTTSDPMALLGTRRPLPWDADTVARRVAAALQRARSMPGSEQPVDAAELREDPLAQYAANLERVLQTLPRDSTRRFINATALRLQERVNEIAAFAAERWRQASESETESPDALRDRLAAASTFPELNDAYTHEALHLVCNALDEAEAEARRRGLKVNTVRDALDQVVGLNGSLTVDGEAVPQMHAVLYPVLRVLEDAQQRLGLAGEPAAQIPETEAPVAEPAPSTSSSPEEPAVETKPATPAAETGAPDSPPAPDAATASDSGRQADPEEGQPAAVPAGPTDEDLVAILEQWPVDQLAKFVRSMSGQRLITPGRMQVRFTPTDGDGMQGNAYSLADCLLVQVAGRDGETVREGRVTWRHLSAWIDRRRTMGQRRLVNRAWDTRDRLQRSYAAYLATGEQQHYQLALSELNDVLRQAITALVTDEEQESAREPEVEPSELGELFSLDDVQPSAAPRGMTAFEAATANLRGRLTQYEDVLPTPAESAGQQTALRDLAAGQCTVLPLADHPFSAFLVGAAPVGGSDPESGEEWEVTGTLVHPDGRAEVFRWEFTGNDGHPELTVLSAPRSLSGMVGLEPGVAPTAPIAETAATETAQPEDDTAPTEADAPSEETAADQPTETVQVPATDETRAGTEETADRTEGVRSGEAEPSADEQPTPEPAQDAPVAEPSARTPREALQAVFQAWHGWNASPTVQALLAEDEELRQETGVGGTNEVARLDDQWPLALREETVAAWQLLDDRCRDIAVARQQGTLRLSDADAGLLADLQAAVSRQLDVMTRQAAQTAAPEAAPEPALVNETQSPAPATESGEETSMSTPTAAPAGGPAASELSVDLGQLVTLIADELARRGVGQNPAPTVDLRPLEGAVQQMQGQLGQVVGTLDRLAAAPPVGEAEVESRDEADLREALSEAQQQSAWFWGDPGWEQVRSLHQAYDHLTAQLRTTARAVRDGFFDDIREHGAMRTVDAWVARAISHVAYRIARRLDGNGQHTSAGYRVMWRLQRAAATRADRILGRLEPDTDLNRVSGIQTAWTRLLERVRNWIRRDGTPTSDGRTEAAAMRGAEQSVGLLTRIRQTAEDRLGDLRETTAWQQISSLISSAVETYNNIKENVQGWAQDFRELGSFATLWTRTMELVSSRTRDLLEQRAENGEEHGFRWNLLRLLHHAAQVQVERTRGVLDDGEEPPLGFYDHHPTQTSSPEPGPVAPWNLPVTGRRLWEPGTLEPFSDAWEEDIRRALEHVPTEVLARIDALIDAEERRYLDNRVTLEEAGVRLTWAVEQCLLRHGGQAAYYLAQEQYMRPAAGQLLQPAPAAEPTALWTALEALSTTSTSFDPAYLANQGLLSEEQNAAALYELWNIGYLRLAESHAGHVMVDNDVPVRQILMERRRVPEVAPDLVRTAAFLATETRADVTATLIESTLRTGPGQANAVIVNLVDRGVLGAPGPDGACSLLLDRVGVERALAATPPAPPTAAATPQKASPSTAPATPAPPAAAPSRTEAPSLPKRRESTHGQIGVRRPERTVATGQAAAGAAVGALTTQAARMTDRAALLRHSDSGSAREQGARMEEVAGRARTAADSLMTVPSGANGTSEFTRRLGEAFVTELNAGAMQNGASFTSTDIKRAAAAAVQSVQAANRSAGGGDSRPAANAQQQTQPGQAPRPTRPWAARP